MSVDAVLAAPPEEVGPVLVNLPEDQWYDRDPRAAWTVADGT